MAVSTMKFAIVVSTIMATLQSGNCQITAIGPGFQETNSLLRNVTNTSATVSYILQHVEQSLKNQEDLHIVTNILLQNSSSTADYIASMLPEIILLLLSQWRLENEYRNDTIDVLHSQLDAQQDSHDETTTYLHNQQHTLTQVAETQTQMAETQTQTLNKLSEIGETQTLILSQVVNLLQMQSQQLENITSTMNTMVSVLENQQEDVQNISRSLPIVLEQQTTEIELLNQQLLTMKNCCLEATADDYEVHVTRAEMTTKEDARTTEKAAVSSFAPDASTTATLTNLPEILTPVSPAESTTGETVTQPESTTPVSPAESTTGEEVTQLESTTPVSPAESTTEEEVTQPESTTPVTTPELTTGVAVTTEAIDADQCLSNPCLNGATCEDRVGSYTCTCVPGWTGSNCDQDIDECSSYPCQNGGTCEDGINEYTCQCAADYTGTHCEQNTTIIFAGWLLAHQRTLQLYWVWPSEFPVDGFQIEYRLSGTDTWNVIYAEANDRMVSLEGVTRGKMYEVRISFI
ncbi:uncharacterized protein [Amphiura filiformis]|uniref:uncharacterized protein n=1 Tax=Amphiura filiformis TaxID=82378 RepID=UPI003B223498